MSRPRGNKVAALPVLRCGPYLLQQQVTGGTLDRPGKPVKDSWVLPGRQVLTTDEVRALAASRGWGEPVVS